MERGPTLPGVEADDEDRIVLHVDLDCFYAACERLREPELEGEPVVVGMGYEPGEPDGAVATASYEAREHGVESAQAISTALDRLSRAAVREDGEGRAASADDDRAESSADGGDDSANGADGPVGYYRPVDMAYYESVAEDVKAILHDSAATVREVSIDEAYLDVTERTDWTVAEGYARHVKQRIEREVGLVASVGVAPTMHAAKVASDHDKPDGLVVVEPGEVASFLAPLPVEDLHGIGPVTARKLREHDVETVADLAAADREWIRERWGERGLELHDRARGHDPRVVEPRGRPKSLSRESAFADPEDDSDQVRERLRALASAVADRARSKDAMYRTIGIKVVLPPYDVNTRERSLSGPVDDPELVERVALDLHEEFADERPRKVGVRVSNLQFGAADQSTLGGWDGDAAEAETTASEAPSDGSVDPSDGSPDSTGDGGSSANRSATDPAPGHVLGLDFGDESGRAADDSESAAPAPDQPSASPAADQPEDAGQSAAPADASASEETAGSAASGATTADSSGGALDLDAAASDGSAVEPGAGDSSSDSRSSTAPSSTAPSSTGADLDAGQASLGSIAEAAEDAPDATRDAEDAGDGAPNDADVADAADGGADEASDAGRGSRPPADSDGSHAARDSAGDSCGTSRRPDDLPAGQTTLFDFW